MDNNMLPHCDSGPAMKWADGMELYYLNGVKVPKKIVTTPADKISPDIVLKTKNVEVRKEVVRKIGIDRVINALGGQVIDTWDTYDLIRLDIPEMKIIPQYLKMINPSTGAIHFEGVPPEIKTCKEALSWRVGGLDWNPEQLT
jgi:hypothetical protein